MGGSGWDQSGRWWGCVAMRVMRPLNHWDALPLSLKYPHRHRIAVPQSRGPHPGSAAQAPPRPATFRPVTAPGTPRPVA